MELPRRNQLVTALQCSNMVNNDLGTAAGMIWHSNAAVASNTLMTEQHL